MVHHRWTGERKNKSSVPLSSCCFCCRNSAWTSGALRGEICPRQEKMKEDGTSQMDRGEEEFGRNSA